jgi:hypothetical protein
MLSCVGVWLHVHRCGGWNGVACRPRPSIVIGGPCQCGTDTRGAPLQVLGFDTETRPAFRKGQGANPVSLVQLVTLSGAAYLFRLREGACVDHNGPTPPHNCHPFTRCY